VCACVSKEWKLKEAWIVNKEGHDAEKRSEKTLEKTDRKVDEMSFFAARDIFTESICKEVGAIQNTFVVCDSMDAQKGKNTTRYTIHNPHLWIPNLEGFVVKDDAICDCPHATQDVRFVFE